MVMHKNVLRPLALMAALSSTYAVEAAAPVKQAQELQQILQAIKTENKGIPLNGEIQALGNKEHSFNQAELLEMCEIATKKMRGDDEIMASEHYAQLDAMLKTLVKQLKDYRVSGFGFAHHTSFNIFYGKENFDFSLVFKNATGETLAQKFNLKYSSFGWQNQVVYRFDAMFVVNSDLSSFDVRSPLELSTGFSGGWRLPFTGPTRELSAEQQRENFDRGMRFLGNPAGIVAPDFKDQHLTYPLAVLGVTVLPFKTAKGSLVIAHLGAGATGLSHCNGMLSANAFNAAVVTGGGTLTPKAS